MSFELLDLVLHCDMWTLSYLQAQLQCGTWQSQLQARIHNLCIPCISVGTGHSTPCVHFKFMVFERCVVVQAYVLQHCIGDNRLNTYMYGWSKLYAMAPNSVGRHDRIPNPALVTRHRRTRSHSTGPVTHTAGIQYPADPTWGPTTQIA